MREVDECDTEEIDLEDVCLDCVYAYDEYEEWHDEYEEWRL